ncbi:hypothetical protein TWF730_002591 [Orbilia blumenaviensis]|uniref:Uncharacterized protein n=1 Tax=Orbilia blumenaviensis TaxID=1796055 RepID=A0AAV9UAK5_9PEZI
MANIISISSAKATALHPVVEADGTTPVFTTTNTLLYQNGTTYPACFSIADLATGSLELNITFSVAMVPQNSEDFPQWSAIPEVTISFGSCNPQSSIGGTSNDTPSSVSGQFTVPYPGSLTDATNLFTATVTVNLGSLATSNKTPWGFKGALNCGSSSNGGGIPFYGVGYMDFELEIYAVGTHPAQFLMIEGIPVDLLRFALLPTTTVENAKTILSSGYPTYAGQQVFEGNGFVYETFYGNPNFCQGGGQGYSNFDLRRFLHYWKLFAPGSTLTTEADDLLSYNRDAKTVNCFDQAAIVWLVLSLGFQSQADQQAVSSWHMSPYGFIDGSLVGWGPTDNPLFKGDKTKMIIPKQSPDRKPFGSHVFLSWYGKVFDSCAGPHLGTEDLNLYLSKALDSDYWTGYINKKTGKPWQNGTAADAEDASPAKQRRGQVGGIENYYDDGRYMPDVDYDRQKERSKALQGVMKGKGYNGLQVIQSNIQSALSGLGYSNVIVTNPKFWTADFSKELSKHNQTYGYTKLHVGGTGQNGRIGIDLTLNFCNTPEAALGYLTDKGKKITIPTTDLTETLSSTTTVYFPTRGANEVDDGHVYDALPIRFCLQNLYIEVLVNKITWSQASDILNSFIKIINSGLEMTEPTGIAVDSTVNFAIAGGASGVLDTLDENSSITVKVGQSVQLTVQVTDFEDIDWRYFKGSTGSIILRKWSVKGSTATIDVYARSAGEDILTLNFFDQWFQTETIEIDIVVE